MSARTLFFLLAVLHCGTSVAQAQSLPGNRNLVSNGGFEFSTCGTLSYTDTTFTNNPRCWISANRSASPFLCPGSYYPDFNVRARSGHGAFILARGYSRLNLSTGVWTDTADQLRSYAETRLLEPLIAGKAYHLKFYFGTVLDTAAPTPAQSHNQDVVSNVGAYFSGTVLRGGGFGRINVVPQLNFTSHVLPLVDSFMYVELTGTYIARGGEQYLTIGNFDALSSTVFMHITKHSRAAGLTTAYLNSVFIDDVSLVADTSRPVVSLDRFELGNDTTICPGTSMQLAAPPHFFHYWWNTGDTTPVTTISGPGLYWCTVDYGCGTITDTIRVSAATPPRPFDLPDTVLCSGIPFIAKAPAGYPDYLWSTGASSESIAIHVPGSFWAEVVNACGQSYRDTFSLVTKPSTTPGININTIPPIILCKGTPITFITNITGAANNPSYQWYKNGVEIPGATSVSYTDAVLEDGDTLTVAMYSSVACPVTWPTISNRVGVRVSPVVVPSVTIFASPAATIIAGQPVTFTASASNGGTAAAYTWFRSGIPVPGNTTASWTVSDLSDGEFVGVRLESSEPCPKPPLVNSNVIQVTVVGAAAIHPQGAPSVSVYPNPTAGMINVVLTALRGDAGIVLYDNLGRRVHEQPLRELKTTFSLRHLPAGIYQYRLQSGGERFSGRIVKQ